MPPYDDDDEENEDEEDEQDQEDEVVDDEDEDEDGDGNGDEDPADDDADEDGDQAEDGDGADDDDEDAEGGGGEDDEEGEDGEEEEGDEDDEGEDGEEEPGSVLQSKESLVSKQASRKPSRQPSRNQARTRDGRATAKTPKPVTAKKDPPAAQQQKSKIPEPVRRVRQPDAMVNLGPVRTEPSKLDEFKSKRIRVFRNGDMFNAAKRFVVSQRIYRNFEQFLLNVSMDLGLANGAVRKIYTIEGDKVVRDLSEIEDGGIYVASAGEHYRSIPYPITSDMNVGYVPGRQAAAGGAGGGGAAPARKPVLRRGGWGVRPKEEEDSREKEKERLLKDPPIFMPSSKGYRVVLYRNGDITAPMRIVLNYRNCKSTDHLLSTVNGQMRLKSGMVRKFYDAESGRKIRNLKDISDGQTLVAAAWEAFIPARYPIVNPNLQLETHKEAEIPKSVTFYPNGDSYHHGFTISMTKSRYPNLKKLIDHINITIDLPGGRVTRIHGMDGRRLDSIERLFTTLEHPTDASHPRSFVISCADDPFYPVPYDINRPQQAASHFIGLGGSTTHNEYLTRIRKVRDPIMRRVRKATDGTMQALEAETAAAPAGRSRAASVKAGAAKSAKSRGGRSAKAASRRSSRRSASASSVGSGSESDSAEEVEEDEAIRDGGGDGGGHGDQAELREFNDGKEESEEESEEEEEEDEEEDEDGSRETMVASEETLDAGDAGGSKESLEDDGSQETLEAGDGSRESLEQGESQESLEDEGVSARSSKVRASKNSVSTRKSGLPKSVKGSTNSLTSNSTPRRSLAQ
ncbi:hypothetical protein HK101_005836 [Irineochytrium annulatum]|nr:hypothetical protein HK101_005836 [Irineochytrium annulatum]